ncbi:MAG: YlxR family protein [Firmicutes bacterium]|nr:YlxR family protein [Bacillota bacterium]
MSERKIPMRKCVGCMESKPKNSLVRIACYEGVVTVDLTGRAKGRGVYLCKDPECREKAKKRRALQRSFDAGLTQEDIDKIFQELADNE